MCSVRTRLPDGFRVRVDNGKDFIPPVPVPRERTNWKVVFLGAAILVATAVFGSLDVPTAIGYVYGLVSMAVFSVLVYRQVP